MLFPINTYIYTNYHSHILSLPHFDLNTLRYLPGAFIINYTGTPIMTRLFNKAWLHQNNMLMVQMRCMHSAFQYSYVGCGLCF